MNETGYIRLLAMRRMEVDEGLTDAERTEVAPTEESFDDLALRFGFAEA